MDRKSGIVSCTFLLAGVLAGFVGGTRYATRNQRLAEPMVTPQPETGWHLASGTGSGTTLVSPPRTAAASNTGPPETAWFPESIQTATSRPRPLETFPEQEPGAASGVTEFPGDSLPMSEPSTPLTPEQQEMWKNQMNRLSAVDIEELLRLRQRLSQTTGPAAPAVEPLSSVDRSREIPETLPEPGRLQLPATDELRPALPAGPFLPDSIELTAATRAAVAPGHLLLEQARRVAGDNRANVATIGYRRREVLVLRAPTADLQDVDSSTWITRIDLRPGEIISTRNPFDVAIRGAGWFRVQGSESEYFTRCGLLAMDSQRRLCVRTGRGPLPLVPEIVLPADMVLMEIGTGGQVSVRAADDETATISGRIELVDFRAAGQLAWTPAGVFEAGGKSGRPFLLPAEKVEILQRSLEESNVDLRCEAQMLDRLQGVISTGSTP